ncbi:hypothetical protein V5740_00030 [Croceibacterium sp. TMG7-5b_MA50]|uniref:hypothetical protein n=1 Tax=Croceibacterium sp. TMG7-5b_MA50 TaxID=3121290 RepID=UPI003221D0AC
MRPLALSSLLLLAACTVAEDAATGTAADADDVPAARVLGPGERCLQASLIQNTDVQGAQVIDFRMRDGRTFRSTLPASCPGLAFEQRIAYDVSVGRLCHTDTVTVLHWGGGNTVPGARCRLGEFVPVELIEPDRDGTLD